MGGGQTHNLLKSHYKKSLFALIKATKRYYLGIWLIKLPFYAIFSESKAKKYREKRKVRYENLQIAKKRFKTIRKLAPQIKSWVKSDEFKEKYANHPYPPLLNPQTLDYESISAELAWELNLPLPKGYKFICVMASFNGHTAMVLGLKKCGVCIMGDHIADIKAHYAYNYEQILQGQFVAINITAYNGTHSAYFRDLEKLILLCDKRTPILMLVRDPISRLKSSLNNSWSKGAVQNHYDDSTLPLSALENRLDYHIPLDLSHIQRITKSMQIHTFKYGDLADFFCKYGFENIDMLDILRIYPSNAFVTFCKLSAKYGFTPPPNKDFLPRAHIQEFCGFLPLRYEVEGVEFTITSAKNDTMCEVNLECNNRGIYIYANTQTIPQNTLDKLEKFIEKLIACVDFENKYHKTSENALIELLTREVESLKFICEIFRKEASFVRKLRPDIVASWKYYNEFEKITL